MLKLQKRGGGKVITVTQYLQSKGYQTCEYIQSSGTQYIDTGIVCAWGDTLFCDVQMLSTDVWAGIVGSTKAANTTPYVKVGKKDTNYLNLEMVTGGSVQNTILSTDRHQIQVNFNSGNSIIFLDGTQRYTDTQSGTLNTYTEWIFGYNSGGSLLEPSNLKVFRLIWRRGVSELRNYYPVYNLTSGAIGLYDLVSDSFFGNNGSGTFTKGPDISIDDLIG